MIKQLEAISRALGNAQTLHGSSKYFYNEAKNTKIKNPYGTSLTFTFEGPATAKVNEPVIFHGTAPAGLIRVFSSTMQERKLYAKNGEYYLALYFSKPGIYDMYAISQAIESKHLSVKVD